MNVEKAVNFLKQTIIILLRERIQLKSKHFFTMYDLIQDLYCIEICNSFCFSLFFVHIALEKGWSG